MSEIAEKLADLLRPEAFPHSAADPRLVETHISWVILAGNFAYKIRKPVNFGFLDFSTLEERRADCETEVRLNRRLCPDLYLGVVNICERDGRLWWDGVGRAIEPAVRMRRLPEPGMLPALVARRVADERLMHRIAGQLASFHAAADTGPGIDDFASLAQLRANWSEIFAQAGTVGPEIRQRIQAYVEHELTTGADVFVRRVRDGCIREGHGDLHAGSVCAVRRRLYLFDCIEFNKRFRCADVAADVAFLAMDLEHLGRADLSATFVDEYVRASGDRELPAVLDFYKCYRAFVRGKVLGFRLLQQDLYADELEHIAQDSRAYFDLAYTYASRTSRPLLLVTMGLPATGKTTLAQAVAGRLGLVHLSSDVVRKQIVGVAPGSHGLDAFGCGLYRRTMTRGTYARLLRKAAHWLRRGRSVVLDGTFGQPTYRVALRQLARRTGAHLLVVVCRADEAIIRQRLSRRYAEPDRTSDARLELWPALRAAFVEPCELPMLLNVDTSRSVDQGVQEVLAAARSVQEAGSFRPQAA
jgi:aminoglycoside phosphotransferase family enzyme/predicted kinase